MSEEQRQHFLVEHVWRAIRASLLLIALFIWITQDGISQSDLLVIFFACLAHLTEQFHGFLCNRIQRFLGWVEDFSDWE